MASEAIKGDDSCGLQRRWTLDPTLADMLVDLDEWARRTFAAARFRWPGLFIISGYRSAGLQAELNPLAPASLHTRCPSLAADLRVGDVPASITTPEFWAVLGQRWRQMGGRWGGDFLPPEGPDYNHFDLQALSITV